MHDWTTVEISQSKLNNGTYALKININEKEYTVGLNEKPEEYQDVKLYNSDPWHPPAAVLIQNLEAHTTPE